MMQTIDVVMPVYDTPENVERTIASFFGSTYGFTANFRLLVLNDGSPGTDEDWSNVKTASDEYIHRSNKGIGATLNDLIIGMAKSEWVIILESDALAPHDWFNRVVEQLSLTLLDHPKMAWMGFKIVDDVGDMVFYYREMNAVGDTIGLPLGKDASAPYYNVRRPVTQVSNVCSVINRKAFIEIGGADPNLKKQWVDSDIGMALNDKGYQVIANPKISIGHTRPHVPAQQDAEDYGYFLTKWRENYARKQSKS